ncbi:ABC transporter permease [Rhizobium paknamense]|uniref:Spermidine/putrescine transport system permease protein n=1 Tax=Rhizobium paknamense TaxID=1206817 RepID=A0ABU0IF22_9HYPH|nr:ABC transporter permease subunit [Rhizobium paknamense]MDQ0456838.1 spermidine/putrescine transport system permease protein [Rhizobium paknamense]
MNRAAAVALTLALAFFYLPIAVLSLFSFNSSALMAFPLQGFTLDWYRELAGNAAFRSGFLTSFLISQPVGMLSALIGLLAALALTAPRLRGRVVFIALLVIPFLVPKTVLSISQAMLLSWAGLGRGAAALIAAQTLVAIPFTTTIIAAVLVRLDPRLEEAARDLGATPWQTFRRVTFPQIRGAVGAAYSIGVILSLADLTISMFLAGRTQPLSLIVASEFRRELKPDLNAMQVVVLCLTALIVFIGELLRRRRRTPVPAPL